ncbi:PqqD family protein [uncultured Thiodictyon sp.]|uniref:PqqD family protein n=1 Tax=uncultured Thiodictyon sp. TaxID=1846217 RepID=UPI0025F3C566|nr:PqqD family protein [uncultured Thiodictyon sp.]
MTGITATDIGADTHFNGITLRRLQALVRSPDGHAFDGKTGRSFRLNDSGQLALDLVTQGLSEVAVVNRLAARYAQHPAVVRVGLESFVGQLKRYLP